MNRALFLALGLVFLFGRERAARAGSPRADARALAQQGDEQFYAGRCDKAMELWRKANAVFQAPTILLRIARCEALLGHVVAAAATLETIVAEPPSAEARDDAGKAPPTPVFAAAREEARRDLAHVRARIATLRIAVRPSGAGATPVSVEIEIDGAHAPDDGAPIPIDPGEHRVHVRAGGSTWEREVRLDDGEIRTLDVPIVVEPLSTVSPAQRTAGLATLGVGVASLVTGAALAASSLSTAHSLDAACGADRSACPPSDQGMIARLRATSLAADTTLVGGGVLVVAGAVLLTADLHFAKKERVRIVAGLRGVAIAGEL